MTSSSRLTLTSPAALDAALAEWQGVLGVERARQNTHELDAASRATFATSARVRAIVEPASRDELVTVIEIAGRHGVPIYPVSTGKNWGYGSRVPVHDAALVHLGRMNRILDYNETLGYVTIEPGVTQRHLFEFLQQRGGTFWMDATGASPECSVIGNTMERGFGHTPMGDHCGNACGLEVVLATGEIVETGFARFEGSRTGPLGRWGLGP